MLLGSSAYHSVFFSWLKSLILIPFDSWRLGAHEIFANCSSTQVSSSSTRALFSADWLISNGSSTRNLFLSEYGMGPRILGEQRGMQKGGKYACQVRGNKV